MPAHPNSTKTGEPQIELFSVAVRSAQEDGVADISGIDWRLCAGEFWVVSGLANWEQSRLLPTMAGLEPPLSGVAHWFGRGIDELIEDDVRHNRQRIGLVSSGGGRMFHGQTVAQNVALPFRYHRNWSEAEAVEHVAALLDLTGLQSVANTRASILGRTWRKRVGLARALGVGPEVLLIEQPLARVGVEEQEWWRGFLERLRSGALPLPGIRPKSIVVTADDPAPWQGLASHGASVEKKRWRTLHGTAELHDSGTIMPA